MEPDDYVALFPVEWIYNLKLTQTPLVAEFTGGAHFDIVGTVHIEFADYLRDRSSVIPVSEWVKSHKS